MQHRHAWQLDALAPQQVQGNICGMQEKAANANIELSVARSLDDMYQSDGAPVHFGLAGAYQRINAALAVELAACWEDRVIVHSSSPHSREAAARVALLRSGRLPEPYKEGLRHCIWPGRAQVTLCHLMSSALQSTSIMRMLIGRSLVGRNDMDSSQHVHAGI